MIARRKILILRARKKTKRTINEIRSEESAVLHPVKQLYKNISGTK